MRKKYRCPTNMPISSIIPPPWMIMLNIASTHGRYIA